MKEWIVGLICVLVFSHAQAYDTAGWQANSDLTASFSSRNLRQAAGNYVNSTAWPAWTFCWDNFSQLGALVASAARTAGADAEAALTMLDAAADILLWQLAVLWNPSGPGGFFSAAWPAAGHVDTTTQYSDDNCFAGVTLLEVAAALRGAPAALANRTLASSGLSVAQFGELAVATALACADWATSPASHAWDPVNGGFWWNVSTTAPPPYQFRPDNALFLCANLFTELYWLTGNTTQLYWAETSLAWAQAKLYDPSSGLFNWYVDAQEHVNTTKFAYTNGLAAFAMLRLANVSALYLDAAADVARAMQLFWSPAAGAYVESTAAWWAVSTTLSGWVSKSLLPLAAALGDEALRDQACDNIAFVQTYLVQNTTGAVVDSAFWDGSVPAVEYESYTTLDCAWGQGLAVIGASSCP